MPGAPDARRPRRGGGGATLDTHVADLGGTVQVLERVRVNLAYRFNERSQNGNLDEHEPSARSPRRPATTCASTASPATSRSSRATNLSLRAGVRYAHRDAAFSASAQDIATDTVGAIGDVRYRPWSFLDLFARYENVQIDDPFTVPGDPTLGPAAARAADRAHLHQPRHARASGSTPRDWLTLSYQLVTDSRENDTFDARSRTLRQQRRRSP